MLNIILLVHTAVTPRMVDKPMTESKAKVLRGAPAIAHSAADVDVFVDGALFDKSSNVGKTMS